MIPGRLLTLLLLLAFVPTLHGETPNCRTVTSSFFAAIKAADAEAAQKLVFCLPNQQGRLASQLRRLCERAKTIAVVPEVIDTKEDASIAIAIVKDASLRRDGAPDYDAPIFLKRDGKWLMVMNFPEIEDRSDVLTPDERKQLEMLREWETARRKQLTETVPRAKNTK